MSIRSVARSITDRVFSRPTWLEQDGDHLVLAHGYSGFDCLVALAASLVILAAAIAVLAVMP
jgi:hypothetical protein